MNNTSELNNNIILYRVLSQIPLDINGSNLEETAWIPSESDKELMGEECYNLAKEEANMINGKVLFKNIRLDWDSCDCGDIYGCAHGSYVYQINVISGGKTVEIDLEDYDTIRFNHLGVASIPINCATAWDFYRMCEMVGIKLELSDYALSLLIEGGYILHTSSEDGSAQTVVAKL